LKIVTVNVPESYVDAIKKLVGENGLYPSRSELIRVAVREFLLRELSIANNVEKYSEKAFDNSEELLDAQNLVKVPVIHKNENGEAIREFKTYKILRRLEY
jgi:Arc/MetJ-type ribon-helix-helix transcriptional regulator